MRFCHGSPRSDEELITYATPEERIDALLRGVDERVLVSAHTHIQFDRRVGDLRSINPGIELLSTEYNLEETVRLYRASDDPLAEEMVEILLGPPTRAEVVEHAETAKFAG